MKFGLLIIITQQNAQLRSFLKQHNISIQMKTQQQQIPFRSHKMPYQMIIYPDTNKLYKNQKQFSYKNKSQSINQYQLGMKNNKNIYLKYHNHSHKSRSQSSSSSIQKSINNKHCCSRKRQLIESQIKEEYNLQKINTNHKSQKACRFQLGQCKYIHHYINKMNNQLTEQKIKNKILKRRNHQLSKQNQVFNQYFEVLQPKYRNLIGKQLKSLNNYRGKKQKNYHQHSGIFYPCQSSNQPIQSQIYKRQCKRNKSKDPIYQYQIHSQRQDNQKYKKNSFVTSSSSRKKPGQTYHNSKFEQMYSDI